MVDEKQIHLGIIPDGNRRWAKQRILKPWQGHEAGAKTFRTIIEWAYENPTVGFLTIWGFSTENWNRSTEEVSKLMEIYETFLIDERDKFRERKIKLVHSGRRDRIPKSLAALIQDFELETAANTAFTLNFALDYGGKDEIIRALHKVKEPAVITEESFRQYFDQPSLPDFDLIIRTSGEQRTSGFFIWQAAYSEWVFTDKYFPDLTPEDLEAALTDYQQRQRRFGK